MEPVLSGYTKPSSASRKTPFKGRLPCNDFRRQRTGTLYMAMQLLQCKNTVPAVCHDLQSFYWVLMWLILRHTDHSLGQEYSLELFRAGDDQAAAAAKLAWINPFGWFTDERQTEFRVTKNAPLTALIENFRVILSQSLFYPRAPPPVRLTYDSVSEIFCKAIADPAPWPANDFVPCTLPKRTTEAAIVCWAGQDEGFANVDVDSDVSLDGGDDVIGELEDEADSSCGADLEAHDTHRVEEMQSNNTAARLVDMNASPVANPAAIDDAPAGDLDSQQQRMLTRLQAKRMADAAAPSGSDGSSKRRRTDALQTLAAHNSRGRGKKTSTTHRGSAFGGRTAKAAKI
ncbi:hypothetical protein C8T65DRAFT_776326 [Cerioporus squamosus]|nr:hypothetical protein C8T65DRAFT_776326 [Cerioporus squamosus]